MPITPPMDNKQEPVEYTTDPVWPDLDRDTLIRLLKEHPLDKMVKDVDDRFPGTIEKAISEAARIAEEAARLDGEKDIPVFESQLSSKGFSEDKLVAIIRYGKKQTELSKRPRVINLMPIRFDMDEIKENFNELEPFVSSQRISMHQVAAAMKALAHKGELTEEELECKQKD